MSTNRALQNTPIIIKGGKGTGITASGIEIQANSVFQVTESFQSQQNDWIQSDSNFTVTYVESVVVGEVSAGMQFCQTSSMAHPLTYAFKNSKDVTIFTIKEVADGDNFYLQINVDASNDYFQITQGNQSSGNDWTGSVFNTVNVIINSVEVTDANDVAVCLLLRANEEDIVLNLEPSA